MNPQLTLIAHYREDCQPVGGLEPLGNAGGFSGASLWRFDSAQGRLVLRSWPVPGPPESQLEQIHGWLVECADLGFLPIPVKTRDGRTIVEADGRLWELAPWLEGLADLARPPSPQHLRAMFAGLATLHARLGRHSREGVSPGLATRALQINGLILGGFEDIAMAIKANRDDPASPLALAWLARARGLAGRARTEIRPAAARVLPLQPCLRDARPDHFLFDQGKLTGLVDFGAMGPDSVAGDLARLLAEAVGRDRLARAEALRAYESIRPLSEPEARSIEAFERSNALLGPLSWIRWHFLESRTFDDPDAVVRGLRRGLERLDEAGL